MNWIDEVKKVEDKFEQVMSFDDYMKIFEKSPKREIRTSAVYFKEMFDFFGKDNEGRFTLFRKEHPDSPPVSGQYKTQERIYQNLLNFMEEGFNNKFLLLIGPNGSSKSSIVKKIMKCAEDYSRTDEGALYTFSWIFPIDNYIKGSLGLSKKPNEKNIESYAYLEDHEISSIIHSELRDHPILLIPLKSRQNIFNKVFKDTPHILENVKKSYLYNGDLSQRNKVIFDALLKNYKGDFVEVLKHIRIERFNIDKRYSISAATIEPQLHVDAKLQQITMDKRLGALPPSLQSLNLFSMFGEIVLSNRGILEFSDLLKRPLDTFKYLLMTMESKTVNLHGILTELDIFFIGSSNEVHFAAFKQHPDFNSFKGRFNFIKVPYLTNYLEEKNIYTEQIQNLKDNSIFEPMSIDALCMWAVMTRLRQPQPKGYHDKKLGEIAHKLNPLEKTLFIANKEPPELLESEEKQLLKVGYNEFVDEFENDPLYEGKFGISPREVKQIIYELASQHQTISFIEILEHLKDLCEMKNEFDFLNIGSQGDYHNAKKFLYFIDQHFLNKFDNEVRECLGLVDNRSYEDYLAKYVINIKAFIKNEKLKNTVTGKFEEPDKYFIKEFENNIHLKESPEDFRSHIIARLGAFSLDNPGKKIVYMDILDDVVKSLKESFRNDQKRIIQKVAANLIIYIADLQSKREGKGMHTGLSEENKKEIVTILNNLQNKFHYSEKGAINLLKYLIKKRYDQAN